MIDQETLHELAAAYQKWAEELQKTMDGMVQELERLGQAMRELIAPFAESLRQAIEDIKAGTVYTPRKKLPRPPKYAGPANKGRQWTRQPPRLARSDCRKMRR